MGDNSWKEFSGENNWEGILDPLNNNLRHYIIHYGERIQAIYDSIDDDITSETYGFPRHAKEDFFSSIGLETDKSCQMYTVTNYLYAVSDVDSKIDWIVKDRPAWIGYVAVATDEGKNLLRRRDILVSWRGTLLPAEWLKNLEFNQISASDIIGGNHNPYVHKGFHSLYMSSSNDPQRNMSSARDQVLTEVRTLVEKYKDEEISITVTGHSLGAALATLNAADIVANGYNKRTEPSTEIMVTAFVFASPKVGDIGFMNAFSGLNLHLLHVRNIYDIVPKLPPFTFYFKVGKEFRIDTTDSPYGNLLATLSSQVLYDWHNLRNYLRGVANAQGNAILLSNL